MPTHIVILLTSFAVSFSAFASSVSSQRSVAVALEDQSSLKISVPAGWETAEGLFGIPLTLLGPEVTETRPTVVIQPTGQVGGLDSKDMKANQADYQAGRNAWVKKQAGEVVQYLPYQFEKTEKLELHRMGVKYQIAGITFTEWSIHLFCNQKLFFVKALFEAKHQQVDQERAIASIRSLECK